MIKSFRNYSLALASIIAIGAIGCNSGDPYAASNAQNGQDAGAIAPPPSAIGNPTATYRFFEPKSEQDFIDATNYGYLIAKTRPGFKETGFEKCGLKMADSFEAGGHVYYHLYTDGNVLEAYNKVKSNSEVMFVEADIKCRANADPWESNGWDGNYDKPDPYLGGMMWAMRAVQAPAAWEKHGFGKHRPYVANVDTGVRFDHEDLKNIVSHAFSWFQPDGRTLLPGGHSPDGGMTPVDYKAAGIPGNSTDGNGHGTHTSGTICAEGNNGAGVAGVCWNVNLISYKGMDDYGGGYFWTVMGSLWHLVNWKKENNYPYVIPVNMSLGAPYSDHLSVDMIEYALQNDVMVIAASGNEGFNLTQFPAAFQGVTAVSATTSADKRAGFSSYGSHVSVAAPGDILVSTYPRGSDDYFSDGGTSMAAPHVTGLAGYMLTFNPALKPDQIKTYIEANADKIDGATGFTEEYGWGRVNALKTIDAVVKDIADGAAPASNYVHSAVKVKAPQNDIPVYLYQCDEAGKIANYVASAYTGDSYVSYSDSDKTTEKGVAWFNLVRPGYYMATAAMSLQGLASTPYANTVRSPVFTVAPGKDAPLIELENNTSAPLMYVAVYAAAQASWPHAAAADCSLTIFDKNGFQIGSEIDNYYNNGVRAETTSGPVSPGDIYYIRVRPTPVFNSDRYNGGDYALWVSINGRTEPVRPAPGCYRLPPEGAGVGSAGHTVITAQANIDFNTVIYGWVDCTDAIQLGNGNSGDYYKIVIPERSGPAAKN